MPNLWMDCNNQYTFPSLAQCSSDEYNRTGNEPVCEIGICEIIHQWGKRDVFTILDCLEDTAKRFPDQVICEDETETVTFQQFVIRAKAVGTYLSRYRASGKPVAVFMDNTAAAWTAMIGAVYSGNFYVVIDAWMPIERVKSIFSTLSPLAAIADASCSAQAARLEDTDVCFYEDIVHTPPDDTLLQSIRSLMIDTDPVYTLFTSGSTGVPKGTVVNHNSVIKYAAWYAQTFQIDENTIFGSQTPFYFSMSVSTMFSTLLTGARLVVIPKQLFSFPPRLIEFMNEKAINTIYWVPSAMNMIANYKALDQMSLPHLRTVLFAGEVMPNKQLNYWRSHLSKETLFANLFGPTETTDIAVYYVVDREFRDDEPLPIGKACANCSVMVLKEDGAPAADGEEGELCVRGSFLASGYYNNPEKTEEVFVQNPLNAAYPERIYRTGDIVRHNQFGELMYVSRKDFQIKHQGYRIELGEIETAVSAVENVHECACLYDGEKSLIVLYCTGQDLSARIILQGVRDRLPKYMLPNKCLFLAEMPHNANGKIDKKLLKQWYLERK